MADNEEIDGNVVRGNEWEVVSLTASAYAASPGPKFVEQCIAEETNVSVELEGDTSHALFMSRHSAFPLDENLHSEADKNRAPKTDEELISELGEEGYKSSMKVEYDDNLKGLNHSDMRLNEGKVDNSSPMLEAREFCIGLNAIEKEESVYGVDAYGSLHADAPLDEKIDAMDLIESSELGSDVLADVSEIVTKESSDEFNLPCETWWKRQAASLYANAKETNTYWSIFIAAAVLGFVVLGHRWQKGRRQILQLKLNLVVKEENGGRVLQPISRLKDVIVGGSRADSYTPGASYEL